MVGTSTFLRYPNGIFLTEPAPGRKPYRTGGPVGCNKNATPGRRARMVLQG